jgi:hypothetical protein
MVCWIAHTHTSKPAIKYIEFNCMYILLSIQFFPLGLYVKSALTVLCTSHIDEVATAESAIRSTAHTASWMVETLKRQHPQNDKCMDVVRAALAPLLVYTSSSMQFPMEQNGALYSLARSYMLLHVCRREQVFTEFTVPMLLFVLRYRSKPLDTIYVACWECMCDTSTLQKASRWTELARESEGCKLGYARSNSSNGHLLSYKDPPRAARFALLAFRTKLIWFILCICVLEDVVHHHTPPSHTANTHIIWMRTYISKKSWARWERYDECNINRQKIIPDGPLICTHPHHTCTQPRQWDLLLRPWALYILCWESSKRVVFLFTLHQMDVYL